MSTPDISLRVGPHADQAKLEAVLAAQMVYKRVYAGRLLLVHLLAVIGVLLWVSAAWPVLFLESTRAFILALWGTCGLAALFVSIVEWVWYRRRVRCLAEYEAAQRGEAE